MNEDIDRKLDRLLAELPKPQHDLDAWLSEDETAAFDRVVSQRRRRTMWRWAAAAVLLLIIGVGATIWLREDPEKPSAMTAEEIQATKKMVKPSAMTAEETQATDETVKPSPLNSLGYAQRTQGKGISAEKSTLKECPISTMGDSFRVVAQNKHPQSGGTQGAPSAIEREPLCGSVGGNANRRERFRGSAGGNANRRERLRGSAVKKVIPDTLGDGIWRRRENVVLALQMLSECEQTIRREEQEVRNTVIEATFRAMPQPANVILVTTETGDCEVMETKNIIEI